MTTVCSIWIFNIYHIHSGHEKRWFWIQVALLKPWHHITTWGASPFFCKIWIKVWKSPDLCKQIEATQPTDDTVNFWQSLPLSTRLYNTVVKYKTCQNKDDSSRRHLHFSACIRYFYTKLTCLLTTHQYFATIAKPPAPIFTRQDKWKGFTVDEEKKKKVQDLTIIQKVMTMFKW